MRIAVISDIHGNCVALDAVLAHLNETAPDNLVCLGDAIQGGPQPAQVVQRLRGLACPVVMGNADAWLLTGEETGDEAISSERLQTLKEIRLWSLAQLSPADRQFIAAFRPTVELTLADNLTLLAYHGSPHSFDDLIFPDITQEKLAGYLRGYAADVYCGGHTPLEVGPPLRGGAPARFKPRSVGSAYAPPPAKGGFSGWAWGEYALLTVERGCFALTFYRIPFAVDALIASYQESGRPHASAAIAQYAGR